MKQALTLLFAVSHTLSSLCHNTSSTLPSQLRISWWR